LQRAPQGNAKGVAADAGAGRHHIGAAGIPQPAPQSRLAQADAARMQEFAIGHIASNDAARQRTIGRRARRQVAPAADHAVTNILRSNVESAHECGFVVDHEQFRWLRMTRRSSMRGLNTPASPPAASSARQ